MIADGNVQKWKLRQRASKFCHSDVFPVRWRHDSNASMCSVRIVRQTLQHVKDLGNVIWVCFLHFQSTLKSEYYLWLGHFCGR